MNGFSVDNPPPPGPSEYEAQLQAILNEQPIPDGSLQHAWTAPLPRVAVRMVWETDGEELRETTATHWAEVDGKMTVLVVLADRRRRTIGVWLPLDDVTPSAQQ